MDSTNSNLPASVPTTGGSPFDQIRRQDETGDWWSARELMPMLGYLRWEDFRNSIDRARAAIANSGQTPDLHASERTEASGRTTRVNFKLTRYGAYMVAMNGDSRKPEIAAAQTYFAVKAREAEVMQMPTHAVALRGWAAELEAREAAEQKAAELTAVNEVLAPKASKWDQFLNCEGLIGMTALADILGVHVKGLTEYLVEIGIFRKQQSRFGSNHNMPRRAYQTSQHFQVKMESNGRVSYEVAYATPIGADLVADLWEKRSAA